MTTDDGDEGFSAGDFAREFQHFLNEFRRLLPSDSSALRPVSATTSASTRSGSHRWPGESRPRRRVPGQSS